MGAADVDDDAVVVERLGDEGRVDDEGRAMQRLRRAEHGAAERMSDHDVVANFNGEQGNSSEIDDGLAQHAAFGAENIGQQPRQVAECHRRRQQRVEPRIGQQCQRRGEPPAWLQRGRCDGAILPTWLDISFSRRLWNAPPSGAATAVVAVPAHFQHGRLLAGERQRRAEPGGVAAGMHHEVAIAPGRRRASQSQPRACAPIPRAPG